MSANHTPGPWVANTAGSAKAGQSFKITEIYVYAPDTQDDTAICADVIDPVTQKPSEANARLISAAPDLLEAAKLCLSIAESWIDQEYGGERFHNAHKVLDPARAAIEKATGGSEIPVFPITAQPVAQPAQSVEVQQDIVDALHELMEWQVKHVKCWDHPAYDNAAAVLRRHGIKPTSSEGGAA